jgi:hypothetical protein
LARRIEENERRRRELHGQRLKDLEAEIERRHGPIVHAGSVSIRPADGSNADCRAWMARAVDRADYDRLVALPDGPIRVAEFLKARGRCGDCGVPLSAENAGVPDEPGMVYLYCHWCREHRGETHCDTCGSPLDEEEEYTCLQCEARDIAGDENPTETLERFLAAMDEARDIEEAEVPA